MCCENLVDRINELNPAQVERTIKLLLPRLTSYENEPIPENIKQYIVSRELTQISKSMSNVLKAQGYPTEENIIQMAIGNTETRTNLSKATLIELAKLPETYEVVNRCVTSAEEEMIAPIAVIAVGVAGSMVLLSTSILVLALKTRSEDAEKSIEHIADALKSAFDASKQTFGGADPLGGKCLQE